VGGEQDAGDRAHHDRPQERPAPFGDADDDHHPAWFLNLRDDPNVEVTTKGQPKRRMVARIANAEERARLWPLVTADHKNYAGYQTKTDREIPLVLLEPPV